MDAEAEEDHLHWKYRLRQSGSISSPPLPTSSTRSVVSPSRSGIFTSSSSAAVGPTTQQLLIAAAAKVESEAAAVSLPRGAAKRKPGAGLGTQTAAAAAAAMVAAAGGVLPSPISASSSPVTGSNDCNLFSTLFYKLQAT